MKSRKKQKKFILIKKKNKSLKKSKNRKKSDGVYFNELDRYFPCYAPKSFI